MFLVGGAFDTRITSLLTVTWVIGHGEDMFLSTS